MDKQDMDGKEQLISKDMLLRPPPNHNPLIGLVQGDTLINVHNSLSTLQELTISPPNGELNLCPASNNGLYILMCCILDALRFEIDCRDKLERQAPAEKDNEQEEMGL